MSPGLRISEYIGTMGVGDGVLGRLVRQFQRSDSFDASPGDRSSEALPAGPALDYPVDARPRYGRGNPRHAGLERLFAAGKPRYAETLKQMGDYAPDLAEIPADHQPPGTRPFWRNDFLPAFDAVSLCYMLATGTPRTYLEIGSGESTKFARATIARRGLPTRIVSIDPQPRADVEDLCDVSLRMGLEAVALDSYSGLQAGDIIFFDGSHRVGMNSDVTVFFLEVLPALPAGVLIQIHDVYLPDDYPVEWIDRRYSEQYVLGSVLLAAPERFEILLPGAYVCQDPQLSAQLERIWQPLAAPPDTRHGQSFWFTKLS